MAKFLVQKSEPLNGEVVISGAKNAVLPLMASAILAEEKCIIRDVPALRDVDVMKDILLTTCIVELRLLRLHRKKCTEKLLVVCCGFLLFPLSFADW